MAVGFLDGTAEGDQYQQVTKRRSLGSAVALYEAKLKDHLTRY